MEISLSSLLILKHLLLTKTIKDMYRTMKNSGVIVLIFLLVTCSGGNKTVGTDLDAGIEKKIDSIMAQMSLEEKVGQMAQYTIDVIGKGGGLYASDEPFEVDPAMLDTVIGKYK
ncbi:MAG: hypothetical protein LLG05_16150, partial [Porphyromonadaceae bacterium]|nr:hypothetical protein [Porphyromonadaceae bacterium]